MDNSIPYSNEYLESLQEADTFDDDAVRMFQATVDMLRFAKNTRNSIRDSNATSNNTLSLARYRKSDVNTYLENPESIPLPTHTNMRMQAAVHSS